MRKTHAELPDTKEFLLIKKLEAKLKIPKQNLTRHFIDLDVLVKFWRYFGLETEGLENESLDAVTVASWFTSTVNKFVNRVIESRDSQRAKLYFNELYDYLSPVTYKGQGRVDLIFAHGALSIDRAEAAVRLFKTGVAPKIMFSGRCPVYAQDREPEAIVYLNYALSQRVSKRHVIVEPESYTLMDNVRRSILKWQEEGHYPKRMIVIAASYYLRRCLGYWQKYTTDVEFYTFATLPVKTATKNNWYKNEDGIRRIHSEVGKLVGSYRDNIV